jgi:prolyl oligopeptidase
VRRALLFILFPVPASFALLVACGASPASTDTTPRPAPSLTPPPPAPSAATASTKPSYPPTAKHPVVDLYRDVRVSDDYRWLEDWNDPNVQAWSEAENTFARAWLDGVPQRGAIRARVEHLMSESSASWTGLVPRKGTFFALESKPPKQHPSLVVLASLGDLKTERVLVDPSVVDPSGATAIGWFVPTPDGKRVAVSLARKGSERGDVHVYDVATGKEAADVVPQADGAGEGNCLAWKGDGSGFFYTAKAKEADAPKDGDYQRIYFHKLGDPIAKDALAIGKEGPSIAQWEVSLGEDDKTIVARMEYGDGGEYDQWILGPSGKWTEVATKVDGVKQMDVGPDRALYLLSSKGAPKRRLLRTTLVAPSLEKADVILGEDDAVIESFLPLKSRVLVVEEVGGPSRVRSVPLTKGKAGAPATLPTPPVSSVSDLEALGEDDAVFAAMSFTEPLAWYRVSAKDGSVAKTALVATSPADYKDVDVAREECASKDGTKVPLTVLRPKSVAKDGSAPALLTGYGGFGISSAPRFRPQILAWLEQGGIYAVANTRGGGELGEDWHSAGNLTKKQNVFDDFYACAEHLVETKDTSRARLAIQGGSNGGLLMGAELTQHPEAFRAVVSHVGIYDMLRVERDANGAFNVTEYGSVTDPKEFDALYAYSPYHHVKDGVAYPAVLFMTGANDPRVSPYHSRKMTARLQEATSSDAPILLRTSANTGHGRGSPLAAQVDEWTDALAFLSQQLGITYTAK